MQQVFALWMARGQFAHRLAHQARLRAHGGVAHLAFQFGARHQRRHGIHHQHVDRVAADERLGNRQRFLAAVGLADEQVVEVHPEALGVGGIDRVLRVDERRQAAAALRVGDDAQAQRGLAAAFRPKHLDHASARHAADAQGEVDRQGAGRNDGDLHAGRLVAQAHDRASAVLFLDGGQGRLEIPVL